MAGKIAERIAATNPLASDAEFIRAAFVTILSVEPNAEEQATMSELLQRMTKYGASGAIMQRSLVSSVTAKKLPKSGMASIRCRV